MSQLGAGKGNRWKTRFISPRQLQPGVPNIYTRHISVSISPSLGFPHCRGVSTSAVGYRYLYARSLIRICTPICLFLSPLIHSHTPPFIHVHTCHFTFIHVISRSHPRGSPISRPHSQLYAFAHPLSAPRSFNEYPWFFHTTKEPLHKQTNRTLEVLVIPATLRHVIMQVRRIRAATSVHSSVRIRRGILQLFVVVDT